MLIKEIMRMNKEFLPDPRDAAHTGRGDSVCHDLRHGGGQCGLTFLLIMGMPVNIFAGASQLTVFQMMSIGNPWFSLVLTAG